ncbi:hypothetical protein ACVRXX_10465 [Streptococcus plurextorum]
MYTDEQRQKIAELEYRSYSEGEPVIIKDNGKEITIGYVAEVERSGSGFKAYVITDIKLPKHPTQAQLDRVGQVTMLYEGSTASGDTPQKALDTLLDWVVNDIPMAARVMVPDLIPTRGTVQLRKAADFTNQSMEKYRNAYFDFYGHSLGSMNVQYGITSVDTEHLYRISGAYIYNGPNTYRVLSQEQRDNEALLHDRIYNYVDPLDVVGIGYHPGEGAVGQVFRINTVKSSKSGLEALVDQHMFGGYTYDDYDNMIDKDGFPVHLNPIKPLDINGDGKRDIMLNATSTTPRNLFLSSDRISAIGAKDIKLASLIETNQRIWNEFFFFIFYE